MPKTRDAEDVPVSVRLDRRLKRGLEKLAKEDHRTASDELRYLLERELERRSQK